MKLHKLKIAGCVGIKNGGATDKKYTTKTEQMNGGVQIKKGVARRSS